MSKKKSEKNVEKKKSLRVKKKSLRMKKKRKLEQESLNQNNILILKLEKIF